MALGCDKQTPEARDEARGSFTDLEGSPTLIVQVFGPRETPRIVPIAVLRPTGLERLSLSDAGWRRLDSAYFAAGSTLHVYRNGVSAGTLEVTRGMWPADEGALYSIPGCRRIVPHAVGRMRPTIALEETIELIALSTPIAQRVDTRAVPAGPEAQGRTLANAIALAADIGPEDLAGLDFHARWLRTGVGATGRTLLSSYIDPNAGDLGPGAGNTSMVLVLAEDSAGTLNASYQHALSGEARSVEFRRLVNYADLNGNGLTEMVMEVWRYAGIPSLAILSYRGGRWEETFQVSLDWCVDGR